MNTNLIMLFMELLVGHPLKYEFHPESHLTISQRIRRNGYPCETHTVTTEDHYVLKMYRIPHGRHPPSSNAPSRSPVLIVHGMGATPSMFLDSGRDHGLPYYLADRGFDVWLHCSRGVEESIGHRFLDLNRDMRYWNFSFHEIGIYDLPANIDYILKATNQSQLFYVGHSAGSTTLFVMVSERPEYNKKIKVSAHYAPSEILGMDFPFVRVFTLLEKVLQRVFNILGVVECIPFSEQINQFLTVICAETTQIGNICRMSLYAIGTHESGLLEDEIISVIASNVATRLACKQGFHYMQMVNTGEFRKFDYGPGGNLRQYGTRIAPKYNLSRAVAPTAIFYAERDSIVTVKGALDLISLLPNVVLNYQVPYQDFNHIDFLWGSNAFKLVYEPTYRLFRSFDEGKINSSTRMTNKNIGYQNIT